MNTRTIVIAILVVLIVILGGYSMMGTDGMEDSADTTTATG